ncbi:hypothetical protein MRX96_018255 [Rhipicephalus microplus]
MNVKKKGGPTVVGGAKQPGTEPACVQRTLTTIAMPSRVHRFSYEIRQSQRERGRTEKQDFRNVVNGVYPDPGLVFGPKKNGPVCQTCAS